VCRGRMVAMRVDVLAASSSIPEGYGRWNMAMRGSCPTLGVFLPLVAVRTVVQSTRVARVFAR